MLTAHTIIVFASNECQQQIDNCNNNDNNNKDKNEQF